MSFFVWFCFSLFPLCLSLITCSYHSGLFQKKRKEKQHRKNKTHIHQHLLGSKTKRKKKKILQLIYLWVGSAALIARLAANATTTEAGMHDGRTVEGARESRREARPLLPAHSQLPVRWERCGTKRGAIRQAPTCLMRRCCFTDVSPRG